MVIAVIYVEMQRACVAHLTDMHCQQMFKAKCGICSEYKNPVFTRFYRSSATQFSEVRQFGADYNGNHSKSSIYGTSELILLLMHCEDNSPWLWQMDQARWLNKRVDLISSPCVVNVTSFCVRVWNVSCFTYAAKWMSEWFGWRATDRLGFIPHNPPSPTLSSGANNTPTVQSLNACVCEFLITTIWLGDNMFALGTQKWLFVERGGCCLAERKRI